MIESIAICVVCFKLSINFDIVLISVIFFRGVVRYNYTHEILPDKESYFKNQYIPRTRRISIISRTQTNASVTE